MSEAQALDRLAECIRLAYEDPDIYIRDTLQPHVLYVKWKRAAILQGALNMTGFKFNVEPAVQLLLKEMKAAGWTDEAMEYIGRAVRSHEGLTAALEEARGTHVKESN